MSWRALLVDGLLLSAGTALGFTFHHVAPALLGLYIGAALLLAWWVLAKPAEADNE